MWWSRKSAPVKKAVGGVLDLKSVPAVPHRSETGHARALWEANALLNSGSALNAYPGATQAHPTPADVYGRFPVEPPEAYTLGEFAPLLVHEEHSSEDWSFLPIPGDECFDGKPADGSAVSEGLVGLWRYRLIPKHAHECCPDCGLDRHRVGELETLAQSKADAEWVSEQDARVLALGERLDESQTDYDSRIEKLEQWAKEGFAPGVYTEIAAVRDGLKEEFRGLIDSTRDLALDATNDLAALRRELQEEGDELATTLGRLSEYVTQLAALQAKKPGMSEPIRAQPPRPVLLDISERPAVRKRS